MDIKSKIIYHLTSKMECLFGGYLTTGTYSKNAIRTKNTNYSVLNIVVVLELRHWISMKLE